MPCIAFDSTPVIADRLEHIEGLITTHRRLYMAETWAGHDGAADWHRNRTDDLLELWQRVNRGERPAATLAETEPCG